MKRSERIWILEVKEPILCTIKFEEIDDISSSSSCSGFIRELQFPLYQSLIYQHQPLCRIAEDFSLSSGDVLPLDNTVFYQSTRVRAFAESVEDWSCFCFLRKLCEFQRHRRSF